MATDGAGQRLIDGQLSFTGGVQSDSPRTKAIDQARRTKNGEQPAFPDGVLPNQLAWLINGTVRGGGILPRPSMQPLVQDAPWSGLYQGGYLYAPDYTDPILILQIGGRIYRVRVDTDNSVTDLSTVFGLTMPEAEPKAHFAQAESFLVIQAGDLVTNPLFYDFGVENIRPEVMRRSNGFISIGNPLNEIPPADSMDYYAQRLWYGFGRGYAAGDIVLNQTSGTIAYGYRDSVLRVTENPVAYSGDAFVVPTSAGNIRALAHATNIDSALGDAQLMIFTRRAVYSSSCPVTREDWTNTTYNAMPLQKIALNKGGAYSDRAIVAVNGDLFFVSPPDGNIRSVQNSTRLFGTWGNVPLSNNENRLLDFNDRERLNFATGIQYENRLLMAELPLDTPAGVGFQAIIPLNFDTISTLEERKPPAWEGAWDFSGGPYILQLFEGDFGGRERAFAVVWSELHSQIEVWEIRQGLRFDNGENRISWAIEFPAYPFGDPFALKSLDSAELWIDKVLGTVDFEVYYRPDGYGCWLPWHAFQICAAKDCREYVEDPCADTGYPQEPCYELDGVPMTIPHPPQPAPCPESVNYVKRPADWGYQFQMKLKIKGWCRIRGTMMYALPRVAAPYAGLTCAPRPTKLGLPL